MLAEFLGGPQDGRIVGVTYPELGYAVGYDINGQPLEEWDGLQEFLIDPNRDDYIAGQLGCANVVLYLVRDGHILHSEHQVTVKEAEQ